MAHALILGISESGKTTLALRLASQYKAQGVGVLVLDPLKNPEWHADFITGDEKEFLDMFWRSRSCMCFIDEAGEAVGRYNIAMQKTVTRGRHWGHGVHVITQRGAQLSPTVRDQCRHLFLFCSSRKDGELLAAEWNKPELAECSVLKQGEYMHASRFGVLNRSQLWRTENETASDRGRRDIDGAGTDPEPEKESAGRATSGTASGTASESAD